MEFLLDILSFLIKIGVSCFLVVVVISVISKIIKEKGLTEDRVTFNDRLKAEERECMMLDKATLSTENYEQKWKDHKDSNLPKYEKNLFVLDFKADVQAEEAVFLSREIDAIILNAKKDDEVLIRVESGGGTVNGYGYASSLIKRLRNEDIPVTACVDHIAASGGYMAACVADKLYAAEFAYIGSVGVVADVPNIHEFLKNHGVEFVQVTAGESKRNLTLTGKVTEDKKEKLSNELISIHKAFKDHVKFFRPNVDIEEISTGEVWLGKEALSKKLIDDVKISDEVIDDFRMEKFNIIDVIYEPAKSPKSFISNVISSSVDKAVSKVINSTLQQKNYY